MGFSKNSLSNSVDTYGADSLLSFVSFLMNGNTFRAPTSDETGDGRDEVDEDEDEDEGSGTGGTDEDDDDDTNGEVTGVLFPKSILDFLPCADVAAADDVNVLAFAVDAEDDDEEEDDDEADEDDDEADGVETGLVELVLATLLPPTASSNTASPIASNILNILLRGEKVDDSGVDDDDELFGLDDDVEDKDDEDCTVGEETVELALECVGDADNENIFKNEDEDDDFDLVADF